MATSLGSVVVDLAANVARFESDMGKAVAVANKRAGEIARVFENLQRGILTLGIGYGVNLGFDALRDSIKGAIDSAGNLADLAESTGATVEGLSALGAVAKLSNKSVEDLAGGLIKLNKATIDAQNGGEKTSAAFNAIGISIAGLKGKSPDQVFQLIATQLAQYADGAEKTVIAQTLLGKSGAELLPVLNDLAEAGNYAVKVTKAQADAADELGKNQVRLQASTDGLVKKVALELVPSMNAFVVAMLDAQNETDGIRGSINRLSADGSIASFAQSTVKFLAVIVDGFQLVGRNFEGLITIFQGGSSAASKAITGDFDGARKALAAMDAELIAAEKTPLFSQRLDNAIAKQGQSEAKVVRPKPDVSKLGNVNAFTGAGNLTDPTAKKALEGALKDQEDGIAREKTLLQNRLQMVDFYGRLQYFSLIDAEDKKRAIVSDSLGRTQAGYDAELKALDGFIADTEAKQRKLAGAGRSIKGDGATSSDPKVARIQGELRTLETAKQDAINKRSEATTKQTNDQIAASESLIQSELRLLGVRRSFTLETQNRVRADGIANASAQFQIDLLGVDTLKTQQLTAARQIQLDLDERIYQLKKLDPNASAEIAAATAQAASQAVASNGLIADSYNKQRDATFGASEAIRKYAEDATNAGAQVQNALTNALKGTEDAFVSLLTKGDLSINGLKNAFGSLANSIIADITRMIVKQSIMAPLMQMMGLSGGGAAGGGGGFSIGGLIGTGISFLTGTANPNIGPPVPGRATGGMVDAKGLYRVNERGPEMLSVAGRQYLMMGGMPGMVDANDSLGSGSTQILNINVTPPAGSSRETAMQWGSMAGRQIQAANRRNG